MTTEGAEVSGGDVRWIEIAKQWKRSGKRGVRPDPADWQSTMRKTAPLE